MNDVEWRRSVEQRLRELNQKVKPSRRAAVGGGGGTTVGDDVFEYGDTFATLPDPTVVNKFGRVTTGADKGMTCVVNEDVDGWLSFTHFM